MQRGERVLQTAHDSETSGRHKRGEARESEQRDWQEANKMKAATEGAEEDTMRNRTSNGETASCGRSKRTTPAPTRETTAPDRESCTVAESLLGHRKQVKPRGAKSRRILGERDRGWRIFARLSRPG